MLVVDDNPDQLDVLASMLTYHGAAVIVAEDGYEALRRLESQPVDIIISDIAMPNISGHNFIRAVRVRFGHRMPAIALTAFDEPDQRTIALACGFQVYMLKPADHDALVGTIAQLVSRTQVA